MEDTAKNSPRKYCGFNFHFSYLMRIAIVLTSWFSSSYWVFGMARQWNRENFIVGVYARQTLCRKSFVSNTYTVGSKEQAKVKSFQVVNINHPLCANKGRFPFQLSLSRSWVGVARAERNHHYHTTKRRGATITNNFTWWCLPFHLVVEVVHCR